MYCKNIKILNGIDLTAKLKIKQFKFHMDFIIDVKFELFDKNPVVV